MSGNEKWVTKYQRCRIGFEGRLLYTPDWINAWLDDIPPRRVWTGWRLTEQGIRKTLARRLWRATHPQPWVIGGRRSVGEETE